MTTAVRVENLTVQFNGFNALDGITHTFEPGTSTAVMGVNGSGKTTLLETIAGLVRPVSGRIDGAGERLAYVCQHPPTTWMPLSGVGRREKLRQIVLCQPQGMVPRHCRGTSENSGGTKIQFV